MRRAVLYLGFSLSALLIVKTAFANESICHDFSSPIALDMQRQETDFTAENYRLAQKSLSETIPEWMESRFESGKKFPKTYDTLFQGEIWLAHSNAMAMVTGYVLKLEYEAASGVDKETARKEFCRFVTQTPYYD